MSIPRMFLSFTLVVIFAFAGGFTAQVLLGTTPAVAQRAQALRTSFLEIAGEGTKKGIDSFVADGQPGQIFYGEDGEIRLQLGTYPAKGERGLPLVGLSDNKGHLRMLLRLAGGAESPVIVMKDNQGRDRLVMGLSFDPSQEPFLNVTDNTGASKDVFGHYGGHP